jgi:hypothetical protein
VSLSFRIASARALPTGQQPGDGRRRDLPQRKTRLGFANAASAPAPIALPAGMKQENALTAAVWTGQKLKAAAEQWRAAP